MVSFTIARPWHLTGWAYTLYGLSVLLVIGAVVKIREGHLTRRRNSELAAINQKLEDANLQLEHLSTRDPLTGLFNRRYFGTVVEEQLSLSMRSQIPFSLLLFDIDRFKEINDRYGHLTGDRVLQDLSAAAQKMLPRATDFLARYGGDEFVAVLYDTPEIGALEVARHIQSAAESTLIRQDEKTTSAESLTVSIGVVSMTPTPEIDSSTIIQMADDALYRAKKEGRNRIVVAGCQE